jgi:glutathione S-transferase
LEELGPDYERERFHWDDDGAKRAAYLELNPNGRVPCLVDGDLVLFESLAINLYLMRRYGGPLAPKSIEDEGRALQWSFWATNELDALLSVLAAERAYKPEAERDKKALAAAEAALAKPIKVLDDQLADRDHLLGDSFTVADLNVASVIYPGAMNGYDLAPFPNALAWFEKCTAREASQRVVAMASAEFRLPS